MRASIVVLGGAPIDPQLLEFMRIAVAPVVQARRIMGVGRKVAR